jgi:hypothetical protein
MIWYLLFPEFVYQLILIIGILGTLAGFILNFIPIIKQYSLPIQVISILLLVVGVYLQGGLAVEKEYKIKTAELEEKLAKAEAKAANINTKIVTQVITKREKAKENTKTIIEYVDREVVKYNNSCFIPKPLIAAHNAAALNTTVEEYLKPDTVIKTEQFNNAAKGKTVILPKK